ncbi:DUF4118 domain-containing protein [Paracoccus sp. SMMA_5_TC]|uniref:DUF4118 domain-containing protein n=1 Tax=Paracoccus sp. SMMA_5_TC TaxID=2654280 RepID=UPI0021E1560A|nr:DUF4118 domain-containing protein [Paracoccus sp. SMMA_5_TC]UXU81535.1 DUF4118 domain-containing protein [Paracoccus sp. SMMA_5_TC]
MDKAAAIAPDRRMSPDQNPPPPLPPRRWSTAPSLAGLVGAGLLLASVTWAARVLHDWLPENVSILLFLASVLISAAAFGFWVGLASALGAIAAFNFLFVEPHFTLHIEQPHDVVTVAVFLLTASLTGLLAGRLREQVDAAQGRAAALEVLSRVSTDLAGVRAADQVTAVALHHLHRLVAGPVIALAPGAEGLQALSALPTDFVPDPRDLDAADIALRRGRPEIAAAQGWSGSRLSFYPLGEAGQNRLVLGHARLSPDRRDREWREQAIQLVLGQTEQALARLTLAEEAEAERRRAAAEETRAALLASLSHDLRTPLATILGAVTTLRELGETLPPASQVDLLAAIEEDAQRLARYVEKLLQLTRLQTGIAAQLAWVDAGDVAQAAVTRARRTWPRLRIQAEAAGLPMIRAEAGLLEQALFNLLENAAKYGQDPIRLSGRADGDELVLAVQDAGPGLPPRLAEWINAADMAGAPPGTGLGLPICKGMARALGGRIRAARSSAGGGLVELHLPLPVAPPAQARAAASTGTG